MSEVTGIADILKKHGVRKTSGNRSKPDWDRIVAEETAAKQMAIVRKCLEANGLDLLVRNCRFDNYKVTEPWQVKAKGVAMNYARNPDAYGWLLACGAVGSGKTHLCSAVVGELLKKRIPVVYMLWRQDSIQLKPSRFTDPEEYKRLMARYKQAPVLYIDDFLKGGQSEADLRLAFELIDHRYRTNARTIISTELAPDELMDVDEALGSRILEKCRGSLIWIDRRKGRNYRLAK